MDLTFNLPEPTPADIEPLSQIWGTYSYIHLAPSVVGGVPLEDKQGNDLGPTLSRKNW